MGFFCYISSIIKNNKMIEELIVMQINLEYLKANGKTEEANELEKAINIMKLGVPFGTSHGDD